MVVSVVRVLLVVAAVLLVVSVSGCQGPRIAWVTGCDSDASAEIVEGQNDEAK